MIHELWYRVMRVPSHLSPHEAVRLPHGIPWFRRWHGSGGLASKEYVKEKREYNSLHAEGKATNDQQVHWFETDIFFVGVR